MKFNLESNLDLWIATGNKGKLVEFRVLLNSLPELKILSIADLPVFSPPPENGKTYLENARIKTRALKAVKPDQWVMGEDSGLEVPGLGNLPGIHSAVYAGPKAADSENRAKLLKMMQLRNVADRLAIFKCCVVTYTPTGEEWIFEGQMEGQIARKETGNLGFGYDSIFVPKGETQTLAELGPAYKNQHSHRSMAIHLLVKRLESL
jgi:XTP/dITP diphosphohydrolase